MHEAFMLTTHTYDSETLTLTQHRSRCLAFFSLFFCRGGWQFSTNFTTILLLPCRLLLKRKGHRHTQRACKQPRVSKAIESERIVMFKVWPTKRHPIWIMDMVGYAIVKNVWTYIYLWRSLLDDYWVKALDLPGWWQIGGKIWKSDYAYRWEGKIWA